MPVAALALLAGAAAAAGTDAAASPPSVTEARLAVVREGGDARAELVLVLSRRPRGLELRAVEHGETRLEGLAVRLGGADLEIVPAAAAAPARVWRAGVEDEASTGPAELVLSYRVAGAVSGERGGASLLVPLVLPRLRGAAARPALFRARLPLPAGHTPWESFPSVAPVPSEEGVVELALPVLPGLVRLDSGPGPPPLLAPARLADALTLGALALLGAIGLVALRRSPERRGE